MADRPEASREQVMTKAHALNILDGIASGVIVGVCAAGEIIDTVSAQRMLWRQLKRADKARKMARAAGTP